MKVGTPGLSSEDVKRQKAERRRGSIRVGTEMVLLMEKGKNELKTKGGGALCASGAQHEDSEKASLRDNIFYLRLLVIFSSFVNAFRSIMVKNNPHVVSTERKRY